MAEKTIRVMGKDLPVQEQSTPTSVGMINLSPEMTSKFKDYAQDILFEGGAKYGDEFRKAALGKYAKGMKKGGTASSRADGIATKGKTKGRIV